MGRHNTGFRDGNLRDLKSRCIMELINFSTFIQLHIRRLSYISTCNWHNYKDMTAILKSHDTSFIIKCIVPIKGARGLAFYLAMTAVKYFNSDGE